MTTVFGWLVALLIFLLVITLSIALHELGHLSVAKALHIPVPEYFVGFGPTLWKRKRGETTYGVKALPLGGFIKVEDTTQPKTSPERGLLSFVAPWRRFLIFIAGPLVNIILGVAIIFLLMVSTPVTTVTTGVATVDSCSSGGTCAAAKAGVQPGDKIVEIGGKSVTTPEDFEGKFTPDHQVPIVVERQGKRVTLPVTGDSLGHIGIGLQTQEARRSMSEAGGVVKDVVYANAEALASLPSKAENMALALVGQEKRSQDTVTSIIGVGRTYGETYTDKTVTGNERTEMLIFYSGLLNLGLGFANLLPLMPLDGGRILFALIDAVRQGGSWLLRKTYRPTDLQWIRVTSAVTAAAVVVFSTLALAADIFVPVHG